MKINPFLLERYFAKHEFTAPYLLCSSDCETLSINELFDLTQDKEKLINDFMNLRLGYTESKGDPSLREKINKLYDEKLDIDNILTFAGAAEGIFLFMNAILEKDDHIIVVFPCYQSLYEVAKSINVEVSYWNLYEEDGWNLSVEQLKKLIKKNTKALIINFPHNPTGFSPDEKMYDEIIQICRENKIYLFSDEVYRFLEYKIEEKILEDSERKFQIIESKSLVPACLLYENAFSLGVMSKSFGLAGLRIGWLASQNKEVLNKIAIMKDYTTICSSAPSEFLTKVALDYKDLVLKRTKSIIFENLAHLLAFFDKWGKYFHFSYPRGSSIAFPRFYDDTDKLAKQLIETKGVLIMPSSMFEYGKNHFRIGFGRKNMKIALSLFDNFCEEKLR